MQIIQSVQEVLLVECPHIHNARLRALTRNVDALMRGQKLTVTGLGRAPGQRPNIKYQIESPRDSRRLQTLRDWSHENTKTPIPGSSATGVRLLFEHRGEYEYESE